MHPRFNKRIQREIATISLVLVLGVAFLGVGNWCVGKMVERRLANQTQADGTTRKTSACETNARIAGFARTECGEPVQLHPMRFR